MLYEKNYFNLPGSRHIDVLNAYEYRSGACKRWVYACACVVQ